jgi:hypothetical protein
MRSTVDVHVTKTLASPGAGEAPPIVDRDALGIGASSEREPVAVLLDERSADNDHAAS